MTEYYTPKRVLLSKGAEEKLGETLKKGFFRKTDGQE